MPFRRTVTRNRWLWLLGGFAFVSLVFAIAMFRISDFLTNVGFLVCGLRALEALAPLVDDSKQIESSAIAGYDEFRCGTPPTVSIA
jgi:hypothetical protein